MRPRFSLSTVAGHDLPRSTSSIRSVPLHGSERFSELGFLRSSGKGGSNGRASVPKVQPVRHHHRGRQIHGWSSSTASRMPGLQVFVDRRAPDHPNKPGESRPHSGAFLRSLPGTRSVFSGFRDAFDHEHLGDARVWVEPETELLLNGSKDIRDVVGAWSSA